MTPDDAGSPGFHMSAATGKKQPDWSRIETVFLCLRRVGHRADQF